MTLTSVVIPTYNRLLRLKQVIGALERQEYDRDAFNVVVVSDGSTDGTHEYLRNLDTPLNLTFVAKANQGPAAARNSGIQQASGEYILFIDDDVVPSPQLLAEHMRLHIERPNRVVFGPMLSPSDFKMTAWVDWEQAMLLKQYKAMERGRWEASARQFYTGNTSVARHLLLEAGGFDERFRRAEDVELAYRLERCGVHFIFNPRAIGYHYAERSFRSWMETPYAYGRNDVIFAREQQRWLFATIQEEFGYRNGLSRALVWACLDRQALSQTAIGALRLFADLSHGHMGNRLSQAGYSAIFNMRYYQGVADELGGRERFFHPTLSTTGASAEL